VRARTKRKLALVGKEEASREDPDILVLRRVWTLREALRHLMAGDMLRGVQRARLVGPDGKNKAEEDRKIEVAVVAEAQEQLRLELIKSLVDELPEPPEKPLTS
jgi:hypothetical protein